MDCYEAASWDELQKNHEEANCGPLQPRSRLDELAKALLEALRRDTVNALGWMPDAMQKDAQAFFVLRR